MENKIIAILLVLIIFIYMFINPDKNIEAFADIKNEDLNKSLENIIEDSATLQLLNQDIKIKNLNYKNESKKFLRDLKNKYKEYYEIRTNTNYTNYGKMCDSWSAYDNYKNLKGNSCKKIDGDEYKCIVNNGKLTSCSNTKLYDKNIKNNINKNQQVKKTTNIYRNSYNDIDQSLEYYSNLLDKEIKKFKANQDIIINQEYLLGQQKNYNKLQKEKLNNETDKYNDENEKFNLNYNKSREENIKINENKKELSNIRYYTKCCLYLLIIIIIIKILFLKI